VPFTRGKFCSYDPEYIVNQVKKFNENGYHEVVLTGIDITDFGKDIRGQNEIDTLGKLCKSILKNTKIERLRLSSVDVAEIDTDIMDLVANEPRFMPYFHVSLQSGDDNVLRRMRRRHRAKDVYNFCAKVLKFRPDAAFGADIITGFPGETEEEFANSLAMVERAPISYVHAFPYSRREKTLAYLMDDNVPKQVKKARLHKLIDAGEKNLQRLYKSMDGHTWSVIVEHNDIARAENFAQIVIDDTFEPGTLAEIKVAFDGERLVARRGARLSDERSEEMTNREGVASGSATLQKH
jgi:threonylcarbamoyladenosine tRNA methylthiotransferase MtaB